MRINLNILKDLGYHIAFDEEMGIVECLPTGKVMRFDGLDKDLERSGISMRSKDAVMEAAHQEYMRQQMLLAITD